MADISKIKLEDGTVLKVKDSVAREALAKIGEGGGVDKFETINAEDIDDFTISEVGARFAFIKDEGIIAIVVRNSSEPQDLITQYFYLPWGTMAREYDWTEGAWGEFIQPWFITSEDFSNNTDNDEVYPSCKAVYEAIQNAGVGGGSKIIIRSWL